jgi:hypothetical protein
MPKSCIKNKIISSSSSWDIFNESVKGRNNGQTRWLQYSPLSTSGGIISQKNPEYMLNYSSLCSCSKKFRTSTSCLPHDLEFFMFAVMKTFVTDVSAATGRNDFIFDTWLWHSDLYRVSPFQAYRTSTSFLPHDLEFFMFAVMKTFVTDIYQLLLEEMILYLICGFDMVTCTVSPLSRFTAHLLPFYSAT